MSLLKEAELLAKVTADPYAIHQIQDASLAVQLAAIQGNHYTRRLIKNPHKDLDRKYDEWKAKQVTKKSKDTKDTQEITE